MESSKTKAISKSKNEFQKHQAPPSSTVAAKKKQYRKLCFKEVVYTVGQTILFRETDKTCVVGKLVRIIEEGGNPQHPKWPMIEVQWYYQRKDLDFKKLGIAQEDLIYIGDNEVFPTNHTDRIYVDCIVSPCQVFTIKEYDDLDNIDTYTFFTRANYNPMQKVLEPSFKEWETFCICSKPLNPNLLYIKCDECSQWFHPSCMGLTDDEAQQQEEFYCRPCQGKRGGAGTNAGAGKA
ncbi:hypothetical protein FGO68_gene16993 [Halteria grandinella]|uniref:PHD-type domain-containing protein n=1 Tax=Halteria grandinella TaxID=5974 RepID=A0A8J8NKL8_HALGN|nr:hypothetical protein FGO68_gene16993 [Halteria grandinella]